MNKNYKLWVFRKIGPTMRIMMEEDHDLKPDEIKLEWLEDYALFRIVLKGKPAIDIDVNEGEVTLSCRVKEMVYDGLHTTSNGKCYKVETFSLPTERLVKSAQLLCNYVLDF